MRYGVMFANTGPGADAAGARSLAETAEALGFDSLWTIEHVVVPAGYRSAYPYSRSGRMPGGEDMPIPDPLVWLAYVAAATSTITLATGITVLPQRNPVVTAKAVATLDWLSGGRVVLGVGAGWLREEFDALGVPFERRGDRLDEYIAALRVLWREERATMHGEFVDFHDCVLRPQPAAGHVPIHVGGHTDRAARRAGALGDGFFPGAGGPEVIAGLVTTMRRAATDAGRDPDAIEVTAGGARGADDVRRLRDAGVHRVVTWPRATDRDGVRRALEAFAEDVSVAATYDVVHVAVIGPGNAADDSDEARAAEAVGRVLAAGGAVVVCGGLGGVMAAACRGATGAGGTTVGILPGTDRSAANPWVAVAVPTGLGEGRNALVVRAADAVVAVGGGYGTLSEIALALRAGVPVVGLGTWELARGGRPDDGVVRVTSPEDAAGLALALAVAGP